MIHTPSQIIVNSDSSAFLFEDSSVCVHACMNTHTLCLCMCACISVCVCVCVCVCVIFLSFLDHLERNLCMYSFGCPWLAIKCSCVLCLSVSSYTMFCNIPGHDILMMMKERPRTETTWRVSHSVATEQEH